MDTIVEKKFCCASSSQLIRLWLSTLRCFQGREIDQKSCNTFTEEYQLDNTVNNPERVPELFSLELLTLPRADVLRVDRRDRGGGLRLGHARQLRRSAVDLLLRRLAKGVARREGGGA